MLQSKTTSELVYGIRENVWNSLKNSIFPGAKDESIKMVIDYCQARNIDPLLKPVHIVPMSVKDERGNYIMRDVIMPGIALYRILAARDGTYVGIDEPIFGEEITQKVGSINIIFPKWCKISVKKLVHGNIVNFTSVEYWIENYANKGKDPTPNAMWQKRPYGQLAKCAEAQALRKAFPDILGQQYTAEEMEGKVYIHESPVEIKSNVIDEISQLESYDEDDLQDHIEKIKESQDLEALRSNFRISYLKYKKYTTATNILIVNKDEKLKELTLQVENKAQESVQNLGQEHINETI